MKLTAIVKNIRQLRADAVAIFLPEDKKVFGNEVKKLRKVLGKKIDHAIGIEQFKGKAGECVSILTDRKMQSPRLYLVGTGAADKLSLEAYRRAAATASNAAKSKKVKHLAILFPDLSASPTAAGINAADAANAIFEGALLASYKYDKYFTEKKDKNEKIAELTIIAPSEPVVKIIKQAASYARIVCDATCLARDLENAPGNEIYPETLAAAARTSAASHGYRCEIWDKKKIEHVGFGGLVAVNSGSDKPPRFIILEHNTGKPGLATIVLVGKGITFDAGGISIKPAGGMAEMKMDMSGAAAVIGALEAAARLKLPLHVVGLIPSTENLLGGSAMRPGDIITHYGGKTSEVDNTDAEGRLVLADALAYAVTYKPNVVIDLATLTGSCVVALGHHATGMMGNDEEVMAKLKTAGERTYERVWQLPLYEEYEKQIKSDVADVKNVGGRWAGAITAGLFLKKFIGDYKWIHLDIAGTAILEENFPYAPKGGSGVGVRLLTDFLTNWKG